MKGKRLTVGIIGGMGPAATALLFERIILATPARRDQDHLHIIVDNDPTVPDRTAAITGNGPSPLDALVKSARLLESAGAEVLAMPCMTAHYYINELTGHVKVRLIDAIDELCAEIQRNPAIRTVGVLATDGSRRAGVYDRLSQHCEVVFPDAEFQARFMDAVYGPAGVKTVGPRPETSVTMAELAGRLREQGADAVVAGCTEASVGFQAGSLAVPLLDPVAILASAVVREAWAPGDSPGEAMSRVCAAAHPG